MGLALQLSYEYAHSKGNKQNLLLAESVLCCYVVGLVSDFESAISNSEDDVYIYIFLLFSWSVSRQLVLSCLQ